MVAYSGLAREAGWLRRNGIVRRPLRRSIAVIGLLLLRQNLLAHASADAPVTITENGTAEIRLGNGRCVLLPAARRWLHELASGRGVASGHLVKALRG
jgi:hypothetical protein